MAMSAKIYHEKTIVDAWFDKHQDKKARGHSVSSGRLITGTVYGVDTYYLNGALCWAIVLADENMVLYRVVFASIQLLDDLMPGCNEPPKGELVITGNDPVVVQALADKMKSKPCHEECTDGYCHRAYTCGIIPARGE